MNQQLEVIGEEQGQFIMGLVEIPNKTRADSIGSVVRGWKGQNTKGLGRFPRLQSMA